MRVAKRSSEAAVKDQQDVFLTMEVRKAYQITVIILQYEIWGFRIQTHLGHDSDPLCLAEALSGTLKVDVPVSVQHNNNLDGCDCQYMVQFLYKYYLRIIRWSLTAGPAMNAASVRFFSST